LKAHEFPPTAVKFDPTTKLIVSGSADSTLRIVAIPEVVGGFCEWTGLGMWNLADPIRVAWTVITLVLMAMLVVIIAIVMQDRRLVW